MSWWEILERMSFIKILDSFKTLQVGRQNINIENLNITLNIQDQDTITKLQQLNITSEIEKLIKENVRKQLEPLGSTLDLLSDSTSQEVIVGTAVMSAADLAKEPYE